ncbi:predicted protein [Botrytis cinerea T4]|uniref:Uncharacterized protein n=1 Tax=Botryotinia fuckeliana (strain T4) TaxID=999810 RepID=G2XZ95_BOTF4|nr:predicted protein [Botrytis cinerea T4]
MSKTSFYLCMPSGKIFRATLPTISHLFDAPWKVINHLSMTKNTSK